MKKSKPRRVIMVILVIVMLITGTGIYVFMDDNTVELTPYTIYSTKLPGAFVGYKIVLISDFHNSYYYEQVAAKAAEAAPDIILLAGDMILQNQDGWDNTRILFSKLSQIAPVYMVQGNHESCSENFKAFRADSEKQGVKVYNNKLIPLEKSGTKINLFCMTDPVVDDSKLAQGSSLEESLKKAKSAYDQKIFSMLLMHRANLFEYMDDLDYDLVMAGHIHGGLIRLPLIGGLVSSDNVWFPRYTKGIYTKKNMKLVVSRGCDYDLSKIRVFNGPEVVAITLEK